MEEAIKRCNELIKVEHANWIGISNQMAIETVLNYIEELEKENRTLKQYIFIAPNLDEMTAIAYKNITEDAYIRGRAEEQQRAEEIIHNHYIPKQVILDKIEDIKKYRVLAKEQIEEKIIIADSDSLNYGRAEAHNKDIQVLQEILKGESNE